LYVANEKHFGLDAEKTFIRNGVHPNMEFGIRVSTGSLGQGLPIALGMAMADRTKDIYCLISDGEASEGTIWDILLYNRMCQYDNNWTEFRKILSCKVVLDLDDYWILPPNHMNYQLYEDSKERIENNIRCADMVTVTNKSLYDKVYPLNNNVHIFDNGIPFGYNQFTEDRREDNRVRIFWAGSVTHENDIKLLRNPIKKLKPHSARIKMVLGGWQDSKFAREQYEKNEINKYALAGAIRTEEIWQRMFSSFTAGGSLPYAKLHGTGPNNYMQMYENADIMVIPLENSDWHGCKSNLKILEAASKRIPCIVSNVLPYSYDSDAPVFWVNSQKDWFSHLNYLILNPEARADAGNKLYEWAKAKYNLADINTRRRAAFENLCGSQTHLGVLSEDGRDGELSPAYST
jgi:glycosyltransferase involved in cell wall biosynthesis